MERIKFLSILRELRNECRRVNEENDALDPENEVVYEVFQLSDLAEKRDNVYTIADFYNQNWLGNADFMHIPNFEQTLSNCMKYPIIIARKKGTDDILGISTIKYDENSVDKKDPYFPEEDARYFSITGILTRRNNVHRGIGKKIYEIAIRGAYNYEKYYPGTRIMCVIDCRNRQSLRALNSAVTNIRNNNIVGEGMELPANIVGYYELYDKENDDLLEAPTLVMEVGLNQTNSQRNQQDKRTISFSLENGKTRFENLRCVLRENLEKYKIGEPTIIEDEGCGMVHFYHLGDSKECCIDGINIEPNGTENGNNRVPRSEVEMKSFRGPVPAIRILDEEIR